MDRRKSFTPIVRVFIRCFITNAILQMSFPGRVGRVVGAMGGMGDDLRAA
jgi:hypothetical protein